MNVASIMTRRVISAKPDETVADVAKRLAECSVSAMPVCDDQSTVVGMISVQDLLRPFADQHGLRRAWWLSLVAQGEEIVPSLARHLRAARQLHVCELMTPDVIAVVEDTNVGEVAQLLLKYRIKRMPVLRAGKIVGIVARADLVQALACHPDALDEHWHPTPWGSITPPLGH